MAHRIDADLAGLAVCVVHTGVGGIRHVPAETGLAILAGGAVFGPVAWGVALTVYTNAQAAVALLVELALVAGLRRRFVLAESVDTFLTHVAPVAVGAGLLAIGGGDAGPTGIAELQSRSRALTVARAGA
jgi:hypothetical protein